MQPDLTLKWSWDMIGKVVIISRLCNTDAGRRAVLASLLPSKLSPSNFRIISSTPKGNQG